MSRTSLRAQPTQVSTGGLRGTLRGSLRTSLRGTAVAAAVIALTAGAMAFAPGAEAATAKPVAHNDSVTIKYGTHKSVNVLANDKVARKAKAKVRVTAKPKALRVTTQGKRLIVTVPTSAKAGAYRVWYTVSDVRHQKASAYLVVTVPVRPRSTGAPGTASGTGSSTGSNAGSTAGSAPAVDWPTLVTPQSHTCSYSGGKVTVSTVYAVSGGHYTLYGGTDSSGATHVQNLNKGDTAYVQVNQSFAATPAEYDSQWQQPRARTFTFAMKGAPYGWLKCVNPDSWVQTWTKAVTDQQFSC